MAKAAAHINGMDIKTFLKIAPNLPPEIAVLMRGPTGVGKSHVVYQVAKGLGLEYIDVRGSTMDEAKVTGIPDFETSKQLKVATFVLPSWYVRACREPVVLFLDELNRSMPQVLQSFFQVVLDRCLGNDAHGNPMPLHPGTRVYAAVNYGSEYDVVEMDPALLRRFWTVDIEPDPKDWIDWANAAGVHPVLVDFIRQNPAHWRVDPASGKVAPGSVLPTPASWHRLDTSLKHMGLDLGERASKKDDGMVYSITRGFVGTEAAISFVDFVEKYENVVSAEDILNGKAGEARLKALRASDISALVSKVGFHCKENEWSKKQVDNLVAWVKSLPGEHQTAVYYEVLGSKNLPNIKAFHGPIGRQIVETINEARSKSGNK